MTAERFISSRLRFKGRLAAVAISVSFFVMIISLAVAGGFRKEIRAALAAVSGDISLEAFNEPVSMSLSYLDSLSSEPGVASLYPVIWKPAIAKGPGDIAGMMVKGIPMPDSCHLQARIPRHLARTLQIAEGDAFTAYFIEDKVRARRFTVSGVYDALIDSDDLRTIFVPLADMQRLSGWGEGQCGGFEVLLERGTDPNETATRMNLTALGAAFEDEDILRARTSRQRYPQLFDWLDLIDYNVKAIIFLMILVAGFNMISGLLIMLFRNIPTIGTLKSLGMGNRAIAGVFLLVGARLVAWGMVVGNAAALAFCLLEDKTHLLKLNPQSYFVSYVPVDVSLTGLLTTNAIAFAAIMVLLLIPTLFIAKVDPATTVKVK